MKMSKTKKIFHGRIPVSEITSLVDLVNTIGSNFEEVGDLGIVWNALMEYYYRVDILSNVVASDRENSFDFSEYGFNECYRFLLISDNLQFNIEREPFDFEIQIFINAGEEKLYNIIKSQVDEWKLTVFNISEEINKAGKSDYVSSEQKKGAFPRSMLISTADGVKTAFRLKYKVETYLKNDVPLKYIHYSPKITNISIE